MFGCSVGLWFGAPSRTAEASAIHLVFALLPARRNKSLATHLSQGNHLFFILYGLGETMTFVGEIPVGIGCGTLAQ
jgi:hypothetical protein